MQYLLTQEELDGLKKEVRNEFEEYFKAQREWENQLLNYLFQSGGGVRGHQVKEWAQLNPPPKNPAAANDDSPFFNKDILHGLCVLLMCDDPTNLTTEGRALVESWVETKAKQFGFTDWVDAYHRAK